MKIEVTFDPKTKQKFRDQCISRLREFVKQMKQRQPDSCEEKGLAQVVDSKPNISDAKGNLQVLIRRSMCREAIQGNGDRDVAGQRQCTKQKSSLSSRLALKQQKNILAQSKIQPQCFDRPKVPSIPHLKGTLDSIMLRLQATAKSQALQTCQLQDQLRTTNLKINRLVSELSYNGVINGEVTSNPPTNQISNSSRASWSDQRGGAKANFSEFAVKFEELTNRYMEVKMKSKRPRKNILKASKGQFQPSQTADSRTFRYV